MRLRKLIRDALRLTEGLDAPVKVEVWNKTTGAEHRLEVHSVVPESDGSITIYAEDIGEDNEV